VVPLAAPQFDHVRRTSCTSVPLRASPRVSPGFPLRRYSSPSFGSYRLCSSSNLSQRKKPGDADSASYTDEHHSKDESSPTLSFRIRGYRSRTLAQALHSLVRVTRRVNGIHLYAKEPAVQYRNLDAFRDHAEAITHLPSPSTCRDTNQYPHVLTVRHTRHMSTQKTT
jgi:hypothetical protein